MKKNVTILAYSFGKGAEIHECGKAPAFIYPTITEIFRRYHIPCSWVETVPERYRLASANDEFGYKPHGIKNKTAVIGAVTHLAYHVAHTMLCGKGVPFVIGGDHSQGLGASKGMILAETVKALLAGKIPGVPEHSLRELRRFITQGELGMLACHTETIMQYIDRELLQQLLSSIHILWFDAHGDYNTLETTPSGNAHGMAASAITGEGAPELTGIIGQWAKIPPGNIHFVAVRDLDPQEEQFMREKKVHMHGMDEIRHYGLKQVVRHIIGSMKQQFPGFPPLLHVSFDIDGIDAKYVPATGTPVGEGSTRNPSRGPSLMETVEAFTAIAEKAVLIDLAESNFHPEHDKDAVTLRSVSAVVEAVFSGEDGV